MHAKGCTGSANRDTACSPLGAADTVQETKLKGFKFYKWDKWEMGGTVVEHFLRDRFGLEERISFVNNACVTEAP